MANIPARNRDAPCGAPAKRFRTNDYSAGAGTVIPLFIVVFGLRNSRPATGGGGVGIRSNTICVAVHPTTIVPSAVLIAVTIAAATARNDNGRSTIVRSAIAI